MRRSSAAWESTMFTASLGQAHSIGPACLGAVTHVTRPLIENRLDHPEAVLREPPAQVAEGLARSGTEQHLQP